MSELKMHKIKIWAKENLSAGTLYTLFLTVAMLATATKLQDVSNAKGLGDGPPTAFQHAFFQSYCMFVGELICLIPYNLQKLFNKFSNKTKETSTTTTAIYKEEETPEKKPYTNPLIFWIPALCDLGGTTLLNFGLFYTDASVYQMLRGILVVFTGILAVIFLKQRYYYHHWIGLFLIVGGCVIVGLKSILFKDNDNDNNAADSVSRNPLLGDLLVIAAQVLAAIQNIVEEKFFSKYDVQPLQAVGWEGYWGVTMTTFVLFLLYFIPGSDYGSVENSVYALAQCINNWKIALATLGSILSIAFFNFFGVSITKRISSTSRSTIDTCRTLFIWIVSLIIGWEEFQWLQVIGFVVLVFGTFLFNEVITIPYYHQWYLKRKQLWLEAKEEKERKLKEQCDDVKDSIN